MKPSILTAPKLPLTPVLPPTMISGHLPDPRDTGHWAPSVRDLRPGPDGSPRLTAPSPVNQPTSERFADHAVTFLRSPATTNDDPFFMCVSCNAPPDPRQAPQSFIDLYPPATVTLPPVHAAQHPFDNGDLTIRDEKLAPSFAPRRPTACIARNTTPSSRTSTNKSDVFSMSWKHPAPPITPSPSPKGKRRQDPDLIALTSCAPSASAAPSIYVRAKTVAKSSLRSKPSASAARIYPGMKPVTSEAVSQPPPPFRMGYRGHRHQNDRPPPARLTARLI